MDLKSGDEYLCKTQKRRRHKVTERGKLCEDGGRNWGYGATSQYAESACSHQKLEYAKVDSPL